MLQIIFILIFMCTASADDVYKYYGGYYGEIYKQDKTVLVSASNQEVVPTEIEVVAEEVGEAVVTAKLCFDDETGCMDLETKG